LESINQGNVRAVARYLGCTVKVMGSHNGPRRQGGDYCLKNVHMRCSFAEEEDNIVRGALFGRLVGRHNRDWSCPSAGMASRCRTAVAFLPVFDPFSGERMSSGRAK
jgi:hypothetical protein